MTADSPPVPREPRQGPLRRLWYTPLGDLFRGRLSGRLDIRFKMQEAGLPPRARRIVADVVGRTRLWPTERADVAAELISHFADGLAGGASVDEMQAAFGRTRRTATLIRRAKRRARSTPWRIWLRTMQAAALVLVVIVGVYLAATIRLFAGRPVIAHDYLADLNAVAAAVPQDQRAWPGYRAALIRLDLPLNLPKGWVGGARPGDSQWYEIADFLQDHAEALDEVREASGLAGLGFVAGYGVDEDDLALWPDREGLDGDSEAGLMAVLLMHVAELRKLSRLCSLDAYRAAASGDGAAVSADVTAMLGIAGHIRETPFLINEITSISCVTGAIRTLGEILSNEPEILTNGELRELAHRFAALQGGGPLRIRLEAEQLWFQDLMQRSYTDDGDGDGHLTAQGLGSAFGLLQPDQAARIGPLAPAFALLVANRRAMTNEFAKLFALAEAEHAKPLWRQDFSLVESQKQRITDSPFRRIRYLPVALLMDLMGTPWRSAELATQQRDALNAAIALELYRRKHGFWPQTLNELVPDLLPWVPVDRFDGAPLRYRLADGKPMLYSVGSDGDDDGGRNPRDGDDSDASTRADGTDGDWILWPVPRAGTKVARK